MADEFRQDLVDAGIGNKLGYYMFRFAIPRELRFREYLELRFLTENGTELEGSPVQIVRTAEAAYRKADSLAIPKGGAALELLSPEQRSQSHLFNSGLAFLNRANIDDGPRTVIILGHARSGTSMVARALHVMGFPMGDLDPSRPNYEDLDFVEILQKIDERNSKSFDPLGDLIRRRNELQPNWGFKAPDALFALPYLIRHVRNPHLVLIFRDTLAVGLREVLAVNADPWSAIESTLAYQSQLLILLRNTDLPCFLVSYEKAILDPAFFCEKLAEFVGTPQDRALIEQAVRQINPSQPDYLSGVVRERLRFGLDENPAH